MVLLIVSAFSSLVVIACFVTTAHASWPTSCPRYKGGLTDLERQYVEAVAYGRIEKAKQIVELAEIDPDNIKGYPLSMRVLGWQRWSRSIAIPEVYKYIFLELKQDPNFYGSSTWEARAIRPYL